MFDQTVLKGSCNQHAPEENVASPPRFVTLLLLSGYRTEAGHLPEAENPLQECWKPLPLAD